MASSVQAVVSFLKRAVPTSLLLYVALRPLIRYWWKLKLRTYNSIQVPALEPLLGITEDKNAYPNFGGGFRFNRDERIRAGEGLPPGTTVWKERLLWKPFLATNDPKHLPLFRKMFRSHRMKQIGPFLGEESILFHDGDRGKHDRLLLNKAFDKQEFERMHPVMRDASKRLRERLLNPTQETTELEIKRTTLEVICEGGFGYQVKDDQAFQKITQLLEIAINPIAFFPYGPEFLQFWHRDTLRFVDNIVNDIVENRFAEKLQEGQISQHRDLLQLLMSVTDDELAQYKVPKKVWLRDQLKLFCFAGTDTGSSVMSWGLAILCFRPDLQDKLQEEIDRVCAGTPEDEPPSYVALASLKYLEGFIKETLRLYSPVRALSRVFGEDQIPEINGIPVPEGVGIAFDFQAMHLREDCFSRPKELLPERWLNVDNQDPSLPTAKAEAFQAFSSGLRNCIGRNFAMHEVKTMFATILRTHRVFPASGETRTEIPNGTYRKGVMFPSPPFNIRLIGRTNS